jgi:hypothetical protein
LTGCVVKIAFSSHRHRYPLWYYNHRKIRAITISEGNSDLERLRRISGYYSLDPIKVEGGSRVVWRGSDIRLQGLVIEAQNQEAAVPVANGLRCFDDLCSALWRSRVDPRFDLNI